MEQKEDTCVKSKSKVLWKKKIIGTLSAMVTQKTSEIITEEISFRISEILRIWRNRREKEEDSFNVV